MSEIFGLEHKFPFLETTLDAAAIVSPIILAAAPGSQQLKLNKARQAASGNTTTQNDTTVEPKTGDFLENLQK